jgi:hypothetical protein
MNKFGIASQSRLINLHSDLRVLAYDVLVHMDISIICTDRQKMEQEAAFFSGKSKAQWLESPHNYLPACALDAGEWNPNIKGGIDWEDEESFKRMTDLFKIHAEARNIQIECGFDWGWDLPHIQLKHWRDLI